MSDLELDLGPLPIPTPPDTRSPDRRRTDRQREAVENGVHPLALVDPQVRIHPDADRTANRGDGRNLPLRCGSCIHRINLGYHAGSYPKCTAPRGVGADEYEAHSPRLVTHSAATDVRAWWPACTEYSPGDTAVSRDAARWIPDDTPPAKEDHA